MQNISSLFQPSLFQRNNENKRHYILIHSFLIDSFLISKETIGSFQYLERIDVLFWHILYCGIYIICLYILRQTYSVSKRQITEKLIVLVSPNIEFENLYLILLKNILMTIEYLSIFYLTKVYNIFYDKRIDILKFHRY